MLIKNYGLYWRPDDIYWGEVGAGKSGRLLGYARLNENKELNDPNTEDVIENSEETAKKPGPKKIKKPKVTVDFRDQIGVYALYHDFKIVYVGQAGNNGNLFTRLRNHKGDHLASRWNMFSWFGLKEVDLTNKKSGCNVLLEYRQEDYDCSILINHLEGVLIEVLENIENKQSASFGKSVKFMQERDKALLNLTMQEMITEIYKSLSAKKPDQDSR